MTAPACFHLLPGTTGQDWVDWASKGAPWAKVCDAESIARVKANGARCYWRPYLGSDDGGVIDANAWAKRVIDSVHYTGGVWPDACGFRNEMPANAAQGLNYATYRDRLREAGYTGLVVLGSFSVGTPDWPEWAPMLAAIPGGPPDAIECHEYWADHMGDHAPWYELRHVEAIRRGLLRPDTKLFIGEAGRDSPPGASPGGWQGVISAEQQAANLTAYLAACAPGVEAVFVFAEGIGGQWARYATRGTPIEATIRRSWQGGPAVSLKGIDVSNYQPNTDWGKVAAAGYSFCFVKATEGTGYTNPQFARDWAAAKAAGLVRGAYHFYAPGVDPAAQADRFLATVGPLSPGDLLALDIETGDGDLSGPAKAFLDRCQPGAGVRPLLYSFSAFLQATDPQGRQYSPHGLTAAATGNPKLWLANYAGQWPATPVGWPDIAIWQHSSTASVPGVQGNCDENYTPLTRDQLVALGYQGGQPAVDTALAYYQQGGGKIDPTHALYTQHLKPVYDLAVSMKAAGNPLADAIMPGIIAPGAAETGTTFGGAHQAGVIKLTNRIAGVYLSDGGAWLPFTASI